MIDKITGYANRLVGFFNFDRLGRDLEAASGLSEAASKLESVKTDASRAVLFLMGATDKDNALEKEELCQIAMKLLSGALESLPTEEVDGLIAIDLRSNLEIVVQREGVDKKDPDKRYDIERLDTYLRQKRQQFDRQYVRLMGTEMTVVSSGGIRESAQREYELVKARSLESQ